MNLSISQSVSPLLNTTDNPSVSDLSQRWMVRITIYATLGAVSRVLTIVLGMLMNSYATL